MAIRYTFPRTMRLSGQRQFTAVYAGKARASAGPLLVYAIPNALKHSRLGLGVPGRVGTNVKRNSIKRRLREAFRLMQHEPPLAAPAGGYDLVINVRPHDVQEVGEYQQLLRSAMMDLHKVWSKRNPPNPLQQNRR
jgi:ribonuclease P protein component